MKSAPLRILFLCAGVFVAALAGAQWSPPPPPHFESLDLPAVNGRIIFIGNLTRIPPSEPVWRDRKITVDVGQVLKGQTESQIDVIVRATDETIDQWYRGKHRLLIAILNDQPATIIDLSADELAVLTSDLRLLRRPNEIVDEMKRRIRAVKNAPPVPKFSRSFPNKEIANTPLAKQFNKYQDRFFLDVPADERLERLARKQLSSRDENEQVDGINALSLFFSPDNIRLISDLLKDQSAWRRYRYTGSGQMFAYEQNRVRLTAFQVLKNHKVAVDPPQIVRPEKVEEQVEAMEVTNANDVQKLATYPNLSEIYLLDQNLTSEQFALVAHQKSLRYLFLEGSNVRDSDLAKLATLPRLRYVALANTSITDRGLLDLVKSKTLKRIDLGSSVTEAGMTTLRRKRPDLVLKQDAFASLAVLRGKRIEIPMNFDQNYSLYGSENSASSIRRRSYALIVSGGNAANLEETLREMLPPLGWKPRPNNRWDRHRLPIGKGPNAKFDWIYLQSPAEWWPPKLGSPKFGERVVVVSYNVDPAH
jgi:hypothetical protein